MSKTRRALTALCVTALTVTVSPLLGGTANAAGSGHRFPCGFSQHNGWSYWRNCTNHGQKLRLNTIWAKDRDFCSHKPGPRYVANLLGESSKMGGIRGAKVTGRC